MGILTGSSQGHRFSQDGDLSVTIFLRDQQISRLSLEAVSKDDDGNRLKGELIKRIATTE